LLSLVSKRDKTTSQLGSLACDPLRPSGDELMIGKWQIYACIGSTSLVCITLLFGVLARFE